MELEKAVKYVKNKKAQGADSISNEMIKASFPFLKNAFLKLFNVVLKSNFYPSVWGLGHIVPIFKSGTVSDPSNYRGITISSCLSKLFSVILNNRLISFLDLNNLKRPEQIGFSKGCRTADYIFTLKTIIDSYKFKKKKLYACFIDLQKAFDSVWRYGLFLKLMLKCGLSESLINILLNMYSSLKTCVKLDSGFTPDFFSSIGVRQGCLLSPSLFNLFLNDLPERFTNECVPVMLDSQNNVCR